MSISRSLPGGSFLDNYKILDVLGAGGFGITYKAMERGQQELVAIKEYFPSRLARRVGSTEVVPSSEETVDDFRWGLKRFEQEGQALALFRHPHIVQVNRVFRANSTSYIVLKLEEGKNLKEWKQSVNRRVSEVELAGLVAPLLSALATIHGNGLLHRDIAPDNILLRDRGGPVLLDFGAARDALETRHGMQSAIIKGGFSPPEQYMTDPRENRQGPWTDIYALAATLYYLLTDKVPPQGNARLAQDAYVPAVEAAPRGYARSFLAAIDEAMKVQPVERPKSVREWREMLLKHRPESSQKRVAGRIKPTIYKAFHTAKEKLAVRHADPAPAVVDKRMKAAPIQKSEPVAVRIPGSRELLQSKALRSFVAMAVVVTGIVTAIGMATRLLQ